MKVVRRILIGLIVLLVLAQVYRPARENPPSDPADALVAHVEVPTDIEVILADCCNDCHSNDTVWPWYANVAPVSWLVAHDVDEGREHLNFSTWGQLTDYRAQHKLEEIAEEVGEGEMPKKIYLPTHPEARLDEAQRMRLVEWANAERAKILATLESADSKEREDQ